MPHKFSTFFFFITFPIAKPFHHRFLSQMVFNIRRRIALTYRGTLHISLIIADPRDHPPIYARIPKSILLESVAFVFACI